MERPLRSFLSRKDVREIQEVEPQEIATRSLHGKMSHGSTGHTTKIRCHDNISHALVPDPLK